MRQLLAIAGVLSAVTVVARGHHGRDFLLMQDYSIPVPFHGVITSGFSAALQQPDDEMEMVDMLKICRREKKTTL